MNTVDLTVITSDKFTEEISKKYQFYENHDFQNTYIYFRLYNEAVAESDARRNYEAEVQKVEKQNLKKAGHYISQEILDADLDRKFTFANETMPKLDTQLKIVAQSYQDMVKTLLLQLTVNSDQSLQCLSFRLDFNTHYKKKDSRGSITLPRSTFSIRD